MELPRCDPGFSQRRMGRVFGEDLANLQTRRVVLPEDEEEKDGPGPAVPAAGQEGEVGHQAGHAPAHVHIPAASHHHQHQTRIQKLLLLSKRPLFEVIWWLDALSLSASPD